MKGAAEAQLKQDAQELMPAATTATHALLLSPPSPLQNRPHTDGWVSTTGTPIDGLSDRWVLLVLLHDEPQTAVLALLDHGFLAVASRVELRGRVVMSCHREKRE